MSSGTFISLHLPFSLLTIHFVADKNPNNVMGGLKATINNPKVSDEAKDSARERLNDMVNSGAGTTTETTPDLNDNHVIGGYKATLNSE